MVVKAKKASDSAVDDAEPRTEEATVEAIRARLLDLAAEYLAATSDDPLEAAQGAAERHLADAHRLSHVLLALDA